MIDMTHLVVYKRDNQVGQVRDGFISNKNHQGSTLKNIAERGCKIMAA